MVNNAQTRQFLKDIAGFPPLHLMAPEEIRKVVVANVISDVAELEGTEDHELAGPHGPLAIRVYRPRGGDLKRLPVILFFHGGGFVFNRIDHYDPMCGKLADVTKHAVVSVDYKLAPEHKFPVPIEEALYAAEWVYANAFSLGFDPDRIAVAGESVGANIATVVAQQAVKRGTIPIAYQILLCPLTDYARAHTSKETYADGYFLTTALLEACAGHYLRGEPDRTDPLASPIYGDVNGLPPALVVTAELDPLRDEGEAYARKLAEHGVQVTLKRYPGMIHMFYALTDIFDDAADVYELIRKELTAIAV